MQGSIMQIKPEQGIITYNDINTSGGQSGSPVALVETDLNGRTRYRIIGIHVMHFGNDNCNAATLFDEEKCAFVKNTVIKWLYHFQEVSGKKYYFTLTDDVA